MTRYTFIVEVRDITFQNFTSAEERREARKTLKQMDGLMRSYWQVGPYSKAVVSRIEESE
jgi:hypothetical protein